MGKLDETRNFIDLYMHMVGKNEVPKRFNFWACLSLLAACVQDRVWVQVDPVWKVYPNLYVFLVGPSGSGKEYAIKTAQSFVDEDGSPVKLYSGKLTGPGMLEYLAINGHLVVQGRGKHKVTTSTDAKCYFVTEELGACVASGDLGQALIATMTAIYVRPSLHSDGSRQHGFLKLIRPCVNWLAGSTDEWLMRSVPKDAVEGGFVARVQVVRGQRNYAERYPRMIYPDDHEEVQAYLKQRVQALFEVEGYFELDAEAQAVHDRWYINERPPDESALLPAFNRADALIYKLALLLALAEWTEDTDVDDRIRARHVEEAIDLWNGLLYDMPHTVKVANANPQSNDVEIVRKCVQTAKSIQRSPLMIKVGGKGLNAERLDKALTTLFAEESVKEHKEQGRGVRPLTWYTWEGGSA